MTRAVLLALAVIAWAPAQSATRGRDEDRVVAMDHLEPKGVTAWIISSPADERALLVARPGLATTTRLRGRRLRDVVLDSSGRLAFIVVEQGGGTSVERVTLDSETAPRVVLQSLKSPVLSLQRAGDEVLVLTEESVLAIPKGGEARALFRREDPSLTMVARNERGSVLATVHRGTIQLVDLDGKLLGSLGAGSFPTFVEDQKLAFVREGTDRSEIVIAGAASLEILPRPVLSLAGGVSGLHSAGEGSLFFLHVTEKGDRHFWLLHLATGVVRPMDPAGRGALRAASLATAPPPKYVIDDSPIFGTEVLPTQEPETTTSGFFSVDSGEEHRTAYEESNWDDVRHPDEARVHKRLLDRFLGGVQWPFRRDGGYESLFSSDDMPFRAGDSIPHLGLDVGARLLHTRTGCVAFHAGGTQVHPLYRGGRMLPGSGMNRILQEVELRENGYLLRIHIDYAHVRSASAGGGSGSGQAPSAPAVTGHDPIGELEVYDDSSPSGGWITGDPALLAAGIAKGNHIHIGTGGIYRSFNGSQEAGARKLRWYQERLLPALTASKGPAR